IESGSTSMRSKQQKIAMRRKQIRDLLSDWMRVADVEEMTGFGASTISKDIGEMKAAGRVEMMRLLKNSPADAYFCGDDVLSIGALSALQTAGLRVPEDVGLIGLNDMKMANWANIDLTTIRNPFAQIIEASIDRVTELVEDKTIKPKAHVFECSVVERGTLRPRPT
ncbi:MAG: substrate-binding domain-containing protein, partial [Planktomarina sp.]